MSPALKNNSIRVPGIGRFTAAALVFALVAGCSPLPPSQEMSDARQVIQAARKSGALDYLPRVLQHAEVHLQAAEQQLEKGPHAYSFARFHALSAKQEGLLAQQTAYALGEARLWLDRAAKAECLWRDSEATWEQALQAAHAQNFALALNLAQRVQREAELALQQAEVETARLLMQNNPPLSNSLTPAQAQQLQDMQRPSSRRLELEEVIPGVYHE